MQTILVIAILAVTVFFTVRWVARSLKGTGGGCSCGCSHCPHSGERECHCHEQQPADNRPHPSDPFGIKSER